MDDVTCGHDGCDRAVRCKGLCKKHYMEVRAERLRAEQCVTEGCSNPRGATRGYCPACYDRLRTYGDPSAGPPRRRRRSKSPQTGTASEYHKNHREVRKARGPAWNHGCQHCAARAQTWAMKHGTTGAQPDDYMPLCWPCHAKYDNFAGHLPDNTGSKRTPEQRQRISRAALRRWDAPGAREKMSQVARKREARKRAEREAGTATTQDVLFSLPGRQIMTLWATRSAHNPNHVEVRVTSGSVEVKVTEDPGHVRHFWHELGKVLNEAEVGDRAAVDTDEHAEHEAAG